MTTAKALCPLLLAIVLPHVRAAEDTQPADGLVVHLGCGDGTRTARLGQGESCLVHGLDTDAAKVAAARETVRTMGLYGKVSIDRYDGKSLPYIDNLVNRRGERQLRGARRGTAAGAPPARAWRSSATGSWSSHGRTTSTSGPTTCTTPTTTRWPTTSVVGPPRHMQFLSDPLWTRHHDQLASVSTVVTAQGAHVLHHRRGPGLRPERTGPLVGDRPRRLQRRLSLEEADPGVDLASRGNSAAGRSSCSGCW